MLEEETTLVGDPARMGPGHASPAPHCGVGSCAQGIAKYGARRGAGHTRSKYPSRALFSRAEERRSAPIKSSAVVDGMDGWGSLHNYPSVLRYLSYVVSQCPGAPLLLPCSTRLQHHPYPGPVRAPNEYGHRNLAQETCRPQNSPGKWEPVVLARDIRSTDSYYRLLEAIEMTCPETIGLRAQSGRPNGALSPALLVGPHVRQCHLVNLAGG